SRAAWSAAGCASRVAVSIGAGGRPTSRLRVVSSLSCVSCAGLALWAGAARGRSGTASSTATMANRISMALTSTLEPTPADAPSRSSDAHVVAELIGPVRPRWKKLAQHQPDVGHGVHDRVARAPAAQALDHRVAHAPPVLLAHPRVHALVADDRQLAILDGDVDQHGVALVGGVHSQPVGDVPRPRPPLMASIASITTTTPKTPSTASVHGDTPRPGLRRAGDSALVSTRAKTASTAPWRPAA